ncbi:MAG: flagellar hook-basal body complex protein [Parvularculaceae bacterium]|nr:flagellar hook-basal body complex protein [Parvularculaceae bacterium]
MSNAIYSALSRQAALELELGSLANNIANASTAGFRGDGQIFSEYVNAVPGQPSISQTRIGGRLIDARQGDFIQTSGKLDLAIEGKGFFVVETPRGERLTRAGAFQLNQQGFLVTSEGDLVHGAGGGSIAIAEGAGEPIISRDGVVSVDGAVIGQIRIADADPTLLVREGATHFLAGGTLTDIEPALRQGFIEASNVAPVLELSRLIEVQRAFELGQQLLTNEEARIQRAISILGGGRQQ